jgi:hypothetical protein
MGLYRFYPVLYGIAHAMNVHSPGCAQVARGGGFRQLQAMALTTFWKNAINFAFVPRISSDSWVKKKALKISTLFFETEVGYLPT